MKKSNTVYPITRSELANTTRKGFENPIGVYEKTDPDYIDKSDNYIERKRREIALAEKAIRAKRQTNP